MRLGTTAEADDGVLVGRAQAGDGEAYAELYRRHYPAVVRACTRRLRQRNEAEEVAQAAFVRGFERLGLCAGEQRFGAWIQVIARRMCADVARARARATPWELTLRSGPAAAHSPEEHALQAERVEALRLMLGRLPRRQREVLVARDVDGLRPTEIAAALGLSLGAVDSLLLRARRAVAASYRTMVAEQGVASMASTVAAAATGGLVGGPERMWRSLARGVQAMRSALLGLGVAVERMPALLAPMAGVAALAVGAPAPGTDARPPRSPAVAVPAPAALTAPVPGQGLAAPLPGAPAVPPAPEAPPVPSQRHLAPARPNPLGEAFDVLDVEAAADAVVVPGAVEPPSPAVPARPGRVAWQTGREMVRAAWSWGAEEGRQTGREAGHQLREETRPG